MNWTYTITDGYAYDHYELVQNGHNIKDYIINQTGETMTPEAIVGIVANAEHESYMNPGQQEIGYGGSPTRGYGLFQWTPASSKIVAFANSVGGNWWDGDVQMRYAVGDGHNFENSWIQNEPYSWSDYKLITDIYLATRVFFRNFERGTWHDVMNQYAQWWYNELYGGEPPLPGIDKKMALLFKKEQRRELL